MSESITTLDELYAAMMVNDHQTLDHQTLDKHGQWSSELPTFGGHVPDDTSGVWSWDGRRLIVGTCRDDLEIVDRPATYEAMIDGGQGGDTQITAATIDEAWDRAVEWVADGDWGDEPRDVYVDLCVIGSSGEERTERTLVREAADFPEPCCTDDRGHEWAADHDVVGGLDSNPGVWGHGGLRLTITTNCRRCDLIRTESIDDQYGQEYRILSYRRDDR